jgi:hypothetical protein
MPARNGPYAACRLRFCLVQVEYFVTGMGAALLDILARDFKWSRVLSSTPMLEKEVRRELVVVHGSQTRSFPPTAFQPSSSHCRTETALPNA